MVTGGQYSGRLVGGRALPYAVVGSKATKKQRYTEGADPGSPYVSWHLLTILVYGIGQAATGELMKAVATAFEVQDLAIPGAVLVECVPADDSGNLEEDPDTKSGEDIWKGRLTWDVCFGGTL